MKYSHRLNAHEKAALLTLSLFFPSKMSLEEKLKVDITFGLNKRVTTFLFTMFGTIQRKYNRALQTG